MAKLKEIRARLALNAATVQSTPKLTGYGRPVGTVNLPCAIVLPRTTDFLVTMGRTTSWHFHVLLLVDMGTLAQASDRLDDLCDDDGETSILAALESDPKLGGIADWVTASGIVAYGDVEYSGVHYLGARIAVEVQTNAG